MKRRMDMQIEILKPQIVYTPPLNFCFYLHHLHLYTGQDDDVSRVQHPYGSAAGGGDLIGSAYVIGNQRSAHRRSVIGSNWSSAIDGDTSNSSGGYL
jgi:hypothetical protein